MLDLQTAKQLKPGQTLYSTWHRDSHNYPSRVKITSIKTWKTRPNEIVIAWKHGLYTYGSTSQNALSEWTTSEAEAAQIAAQDAAAALKNQYPDWPDNPKIVRKIAQLERTAADLAAQVAEDAAAAI